MPRKPPVVPERHYDVIELADLLRVSPKTIRRYVQQGKIDSSRPGGKTLFTEAAVRDLLAQHQRRATHNTARSAQPMLPITQPPAEPVQ